MAKTYRHRPGRERRRRRSKTRSGPSRINRRRLWAFRAAAVIFPFALLALLNGILYWTDAGIDTSLVVTNDRFPEGQFFLNPDSSYAYCNGDLRGPEPRAFALPKPQETFRVMVVGASSVAGYPYPSALAFPRHLELVLSEQLTDRNVEVLNAGVVGLATTPLVDMVRQASEAEPDVIVLYAGHNEYYGVGGVATNASIGPAGIWFRKLRLGQVLTRWFAGEQGSSEELITRLPTTTEVPLNSPLVAKAERRYSSNLAAIADTCGDEGIPLVVCSVVSNLRDHSPIGSGEDSLLSEENRKERATIERRAQELLQNEEYTEAHELVSSAAERHPDCAGVRYQLARCLESLGRAEEAGAAYALARDLDGCRYRAPSSYRKIAREVASGRANEGTHFVDLVPVFGEASEHGAPGHDLFLEHVHLTYEGNWLATTTIARTIVSDVCGSSWAEDAVPAAQVRDEHLDVITEDHIVAILRAIPMYQMPPFHRSLGAEEHVESLYDIAERYQAELIELEFGLLTQLDDRAKGKDLIDAWDDCGWCGEKWRGRSNCLNWANAGEHGCPTHLSSPPDVTTISDVTRRPQRTSTSRITRR